MKPHRRKIRPLQTEKWSGNPVSMGRTKTFIGTVLIDITPLQSKIDAGTAGKQFIFANVIIVVDPAIWDYS